MQAGLKGEGALWGCLGAHWGPPESFAAWLPRQEPEMSKGALRTPAV